MVIYIKILKYILVIFFSLIFNTFELDSLGSKILYYDSHDQNKKLYTLYFKNVNNFKLYEIENEYIYDNVYYLINDNKYYFRNIDNLNNRLIRDLNLEDKFILETNGYIIDGICIYSEVSTIIELEKLSITY